MKTFSSRRIRPSSSLLSVAVLCSILALGASAPRVTHAAQGDCSQPVSNGVSPVATDCLVILQTAVGAAQCNSLDSCVCAPKGTVPPTATDSLICLQIATGIGGDLDCPCGGVSTSTTITTSTSTTSISLPISSTTTTTVLAAGACPGSGSVIVYAGATGMSCSTNADCIVGTCDTDLARCLTVTDLDTGWTGIAHNADVNDQVRVDGLLDCPNGFNPESGEPCGECNVTGLSPSSGNCRCNHDNHTICNDPFQIDGTDCSVGISCSVDDDCRVCNVTTSQGCLVDNDCPPNERCLGGLLQPSCENNQCVGTCNCYFGPPLPLSSGNTPACVLNRFAEDIIGTANVDNGLGALSVSLRSVVYLGELITLPCPTCGGVCSDPPAAVGEQCNFDGDCDVSGGDGVCDDDSVPGDGLTEGTCFLGLNNGEPCDVDAFNETFPTPGGGGYSLDCLPTTGKNVSGLGLVIQLDQTTGTADPLPFLVECGFTFAPDLCPCGVCSGNSAMTCTSNTDCAAEGTGTCQRLAQGSPNANQCSDGVCIDDGSGEGVCESGPTTSFCDGALRASGEPFVACQTDFDCQSTDCGPVPCGDCSLTRDRRCFLDPITASGIADPEFPAGAATFCIPPTASVAINSVAGLPGPARVVNQLQSTLFCENDPDSVYTPGVGGCP